MKYNGNMTNLIRVNELIGLLEEWKKEADSRRNKTISLDSWGISMLIGKLEDIKENL